MDIATPLLETTQIARYGVQTKSPVPAVTELATSLMPRCLVAFFTSWAWRWTVKAFPISVISHLYQYTAVSWLSFLYILIAIIHSALLPCMSVRTLAVRIQTNNGNSPSFSRVHRCKWPPHKPKTNCQTPVQAPFRPVLFAFLTHKSRCSTRCYTRSHVCEPPMSSCFWFYSLRFASIWTACCVCCRKEKHSYLSLYGNNLGIIKLKNETPISR